MYHYLSLSKINEKTLISETYLRRAKAGASPHSLDLPWREVGIATERQVACRFWEAPFPSARFDDWTPAT
jgi:hypothetical protein